MGRPKKYDGPRGKDKDGKARAHDAVLKMTPEARVLRHATLRDKSVGIGLSEPEHQEYLALKAVMGHRE